MAPAYGSRYLHTMGDRKSVKVCSFKGNGRRKQADIAGELPTMRYAAPDHRERMNGPTMSANVVMGTLGLVKNNPK